MIIESIREQIAEINSEAILFDNPSFDKSIVGLTDDGAVIYNFDKMVDELSEEDNIDTLEAQEFIEYNTIRALAYINEYAPVILHPLMEV